MLHFYLRKQGGYKNMNLKMAFAGTVLAYRILSPIVKPWLAPTLKKLFSSANNDSPQQDIEIPEDIPIVSDEVEFPEAVEYVATDWIRQDKPLHNIALADSPGTNDGRYNGIQQDASIAGEITGSDLTHKDAFDLLERAYKDAEGAVRKDKNGVDGGTTALTVMITPDGYLTCAQLGDCSFDIYLRDRITGEQKAVLGSDVPMHTAQNEEEVARVYDDGGTIEDGRLNGELIVTRAFGDRSVGAGLSSRPEIFHIDLKNKELKDGRYDIFIVAGSDGLTNDISHKDLAKNLATLERGNVTDIARDLLYLGSEASLAKRGSDFKSDNISAAVLKVDPDAYKQKTQYISVMDGHGPGGEHISSLVVSAVHASIQEQALDLNVAPAAPVVSHQNRIPAHRRGISPGG